MIKLWKEVFEEQQQKEADMISRHPWFNMAYNYMIAALVVALFIGFAGWAISIHSDRRAATLAAEALASYQAEQQAIADAQAAELAAQAKSEEAIIARETEAVAKMFYGVRLFEEKYHYRESDFETYARCAFNRYDYGHGLTELPIIIAKKDQFVGYADNNPVLKEYRDLAEKFVRAWHEETTRPCSAEFRFAELTENGIFLASEFGADGYARRWHA